jgi:mono/diheme cytochrome c family protein
MERDGRAYEVDLVARTAREIELPPSAAVSGQTSRPVSAANPSLSEGGAIFAKNCATCHGADAKGVASLRTPNFTDPKVQAGLKNEQIVTTIATGKPGTMMPAWAGKLSQQSILAVAAYLRSLGAGGSQSSAAGQPVGSGRHPDIYEPGDDSVFTLPTGRRLDTHGLYVNFTHRFAFDPAFSGVARGGALLGLDGFSLSSFGFRYAVTNKLSVSAYRSPTFISRPIQMMTAYNFLSESTGAPLNVVGRLSLEGQNDFTRNFSKNFELILSRSLGRRAQIYFVPTVSLGARHLFTPSSYGSAAIPTLPGYTTFSTGVGRGVRYPAHGGAGGGSDSDCGERRTIRDPPSGLFFRSPEEDLAPRVHTWFHKLTRYHRLSAGRHASGFLKRSGGRQTQWAIYRI